MLLLWLMFETTEFNPVGGGGGTHIKMFQIILKTTHYYLLSSVCFRLNTLKGTAKAPTVDLLRLNTYQVPKLRF